MALVRCRAITLQKKRCKRSGKPEFKGFCKQHSHNGGGGGGGGGGPSLAKRAGVAMPFVIGVVELAKVIVEVIGPLLTLKQRALVSRIAHATQSSGFQDTFWLFSSLNENQYMRLRVNPRFWELVSESPALAAHMQRARRLIRMRKRLAKARAAKRSTARRLA